MKTLVVDASLTASSPSTARLLLKIIRAKSAGLYTHSVYAALLAGEMASYIGLPDHERRDLVLAALFHDIGKLKVADTLLLKDSSYTPEEFELVKHHARWGGEFISETEFRHLVPCVELHHELPDGSGYPEGLTAEQIPLISRLVCVADKYAALTTPRNYRSGMAYSSIDAIRKITGVLYGFFGAEGAKIARVLHGVSPRDPLHYTYSVESLLRRPGLE